MTNRRVFWCLIWIGWFVCPVAAHPHVWVDVRIDLTVQSGHVEGVWVAMTWDDIYSQMILTDSAPGAKTIDAKASLAIQNTYFKDLKFFHYFGHFFQGKSPLPVPEPESFQATLDAQSKITYRFFLPLKVELKESEPLALAFYDESFYIDIEYAFKSPVTFQSKGTGRATYTVVPEPTMSYYGSQATPDYVVVRWQPSRRRGSRNGP